MCCLAETTQIHLLNSSYMRWSLKDALKQMLTTKMMRLSFHMRTRDMDGTMFSVTDQFNSNKHITLMVRDKCC